MENQENKEFFGNLPRQELQSLCKKHGLPANKSKSLLAKLLVSYYKNKNVSSTLSERSSGSLKVLPSQSPISDLKYVAKLIPMGETHNGVQKSIAEAADVDQCGPLSCFREKDYDMRDPESVYDNGLASHVEPQVSRNLLGSPSDVAVRYPPIKGTAEGSGCSNNEVQEISHESSLVASQNDENGLNLKMKEPPKFVAARDSNQNSLHTSSNRVGNIPQIQQRNMNSGVFPSDKILVSSNENSTEVRPASFEFYVRSEEGINLCVDLSLSPSDLFKSLKSEVCTHPEVQNSKPWVLHHEIRTLGENAEKKRSSFLENTGVNFQTTSDPNCTESSLSSIVRESGHLGVDHLDGTERILRSSAILPRNNAVEIPGLLGENAHRVSTFRKLNSDLQNPMDLSSESCLRNSGTVTLGSDVLSVSQTKSPGNFVTNSNSGGSILFDSSKHQSKSDRICAENAGRAETIPIWTLVSRQNKICEGRIPPNTAIPKKPSGMRPRHSSSDSMGMQLSEVASYCEDTLNSPHQNRGTPVLDHPINDSQTEIRGSANYNLDQNICSDPLYAEEWARNKPINERESSECSQINNSLKRTCESSNGSDPEELRRKRPCNYSEAHGNHAKPVMEDLQYGTSKVLPRRSSRLVSK